MSRREIRIRHGELFSGRIKLSELRLKIGYNGVANDVVLRRIWRWEYLTEKVKYSMDQIEMWSALEITHFNFNSYL